MKDLEDIWGVPIKSYNAREAMVRVQELLACEPLSIVKLLTVNTLVLTGEETDLAGLLSTFDMLLIGDEEILEAAGIQNGQQKVEVREHLFVQLFLKYLIRLKKGIFLITATEAERDALTDDLKALYPELHVNDSISMETADAQTEVIANAVNGSEAEVVLSTIEAPAEERMLAEARSMINARLWLSIGIEMLDHGKEKRKSWFRRHIEKLILYRMSNKEK